MRDQHVYVLSRYFITIPERYIYTLGLAVDASGHAIGSSWCSRGRICVSALQFCSREPFDHSRMSRVSEFRDEKGEFQDEK
eukprot:3519494-Pyramimonas_sp.AAC.1